MLHCNVRFTPPTPFRVCVCVCVCVHLRTRTADDITCHHSTFTSCTTMYEEVRLVLPVHREFVTLGRERGRKRACVLLFSREIILRMFVIRFPPPDSRGRIQVVSVKVVRALIRMIWIAWRDERTRLIIPPPRSPPSDRTCRPVCRISGPRRLDTRTRAARRPYLRSAQQLY